LGGIRSRRFTFVVENGVIKQANIEPASAPGGATCTLVEQIKL